jgi:hypothetical protein
MAANQLKVRRKPRGRQQSVRSRFIDRTVRYIYVLLALVMSLADPVHTGHAATRGAQAELMLAPGAYASDPALAGGCWARLYLEKNFTGRALTLIGPVEVDYVRSDWGFPWDPRFESVVVGPKATLTVYDDPQLRERTALFTRGKRLADLNAEMGIFRSISSMKVTCS